jgi:hydroxyacylglutathione hydrolase
MPRHPQALVPRVTRSIKVPCVQGFQKSVLKSGAFRDFERKLERGGGASVIVSRIVAPYFGTNCWILAPQRGSECIIVDPGIDVPDLTAPIMEAVKRDNLKPIAALITHGHVDHMFSLLPLAEVSGLRTSYIHSFDRELLGNPEIGLGPAGLALMAELAPDKKWSEPDRVEELKNGDQLQIAGLDIEAIHAPGHTRGSTLFKIGREILLSGDVLFKGAIGRTDLPTSSPEDMNSSLREKILPLADDLRVLPGHGDETTIGLERISNPFLLALTSDTRDS